MLHRSELVGLHGMLGFHESRNKSNSGGSGNASGGSKKEAVGSQMNRRSDSNQSMLSSAGLGEGHILESSSGASALEQGQAKRQQPLQNGKNSKNKLKPSYKIK